MKPSISESMLDAIGVKPAARKAGGVEATPPVRIEKRVGPMRIRKTASREAGFLKSAQSPSYDPAAVGLCLSGGGYRATLFHAGAVIRLEELGVLPQLSRVSAVSGGSITAGILAKAWAFLDFNPVTGRANAAAFRTRFVDPILDATSRTIDLGVAGYGLWPVKSAGNRLADIYDEDIFDGMMLGELPEGPDFIFNATNLQSQGLIRFERDQINDLRALRSTTRTVRLADAVAASSAFPPALAPMQLNLTGETVEPQRNGRFDDPRLLDRPVLVDGGVYDNVALEAVWKRCGVIISSYAGMNNPTDTGGFTVDHIVPVINTFLASSIDWRERMLMQLFEHRLADGEFERVGACWTADADIADFAAPSDWRPSRAAFLAARNTPTRLSGLGFELQQMIVQAGYAFADAGLRTSLLEDAEPPAAPPSLR